MKVFGPTGDCKSEHVEILLANMLSRAAEVLTSDVESARTLIESARSLLSPSPSLAESARLPTVASGGLAPWQLREIIDYVEHHLEVPIRNSDLARRCGLSARHFSRAFKASTGSSVQAHISKVRLQRAQEMMLESGESLSHIAVSCGFYDQARFSRAFRGLAGKTPSAWRREQILTA